MNEPHDDLDELLAPKLNDAPAAFRESLFAQTERRVTWNRRVGLIPKAIAVAAIFVLGGFAGQLVRTEPQQVELVARRPGAEVVTVVVAVPVPQLPDPSGPVAKGL